VASPSVLIAMRTYHLALAMLGGAALNCATSQHPHKHSTGGKARPQRQAEVLKIIAGMRADEEGAQTPAQTLTPTPIILSDATRPDPNPKPDPTNAPTALSTSTQTTGDKAASIVAAPAEPPPSYDQRCPPGQYYVRLYVKNGRAEDCLLYGKINPYVVGECVLFDSITRVVSCAIPHA